jgi:signal transduction histidine kinase
MRPPLAFGAPEIEDAGVAAPATGVEPETNPEVAALLREQRAALMDRMKPRERTTEAVGAVAYFFAASALLWRGGTDGFDLSLAAVLVVAHGAAGQVRLELGGGWFSPTFLVLVPALFLEPPATVPLIVAGGCLLARAPDYLRGSAHPEGLLAAPNNAWHAIWPAVVLTVVERARTPDFSSAGWYLVAFGAYVAGDLTVGLLRQWAAHGVRPRLQFQMFVRVYAFDALLAPVGFMAALADTRERYAFLLAVPLMAFLAVLARERGKRLDNALALSESRAQLLEAELEATRARVEVLGAVSHGLQTPVAGIVAIAGVLRKRAPAMDETTLVDTIGHLEDDAVALRQLVRQGLDYVRLMEGDDLVLRDQTFDVADVARRVAGRTPGVTFDLPPAGDAIPVRGDAARVDQVLTALIDRSQRVSVSGADVELVVRADGNRVSVAVRDDGPPVDDAELARITAAPTGALGTDESQGTGVDLYVAAQIVTALGGALTPGSPGSGGLAVTLPAG